VTAGRGIAPWPWRGRHRSSCKRALYGWVAVGAGTAGSGWSGAWRMLLAGALVHLIRSNHLTGVKRSLRHAGRFVTARDGWNVTLALPAWPAVTLGHDRGRLVPGRGLTPAATGLVPWEIELSARPGPDIADRSGERDLIGALPPHPECPVHRPGRWCSPSLPGNRSPPTMAGAPRQVSLGRRHPRPSARRRRAGPPWPPARHPHRSAHPGRPPAVARLGERPWPAGPGWC
jgi:hypothetical protein